ncbi:5-deoxy-glucuronate isomerase [Rhizobium tumorigenes]|uniref:5-deoxy-glucuronate isomerase n=1 Tax=Rhizobium tumorigenes TaxID=2041385 RepID=UPI0024203DA8|nr:5-deoxy-glucuronate isomerase [Rhizobium tumorigenes]WFS01800.1 5-deoxy-glucuronate isomerase [Rhizobium tumorigenes]
MTKSHLHVSPSGTTGKVHHVTPETAGWTYVGFDLYRLKTGESAAGDTGEREVCLVWVSGKGRAKAGGVDFGLLGERMNPFDGAPHALYVPAGSSWSVTAETDLELAVCSAPGGGDHPARALPPGTHPALTRGQGANVRYVNNIMPEDDGAAHSLLVVEVITPGGHTSSYPPHKHDQDDLPNESFLEETYYHRLNPPQGFAFQRVYTDDRSLDEVMAVEDGDVTMVPKGYHPCAACHGYDLYYLNVMAGPKRVWKFHNAPEHAWLVKA